jgi:hypothetical protein
MNCGERRVGCTAGQIVTDMQSYLASTCQMRVGQTLGWDGFVQDCTHAGNATDIAKELNDYGDCKRQRVGSRRSFA